MTRTRKLTPMQKLREYAQHAERQAKRAKRYSSRLRSEGRAEAYYTAMALILQKT